ncbi:MAG: LLM class flavin-dependent oxidoreductase [Pseudolabrys sp.]|nr:LLM class flavin-dependent oxidoreductase [Pseudolabrys sp.]
MKLGVTFNGRTPLNEILPVARLAEEKGLEYAWVAEHLGYFDAFGLGQGILAGTDRLIVGVGVLSPYVRHPMTIAMGAATLVNRFPGRVAISLGTGNPDDLEPLRVTMKQPLGVMGEALELIRGWLDQGDLRLDGKHFANTGLPLHIKPNSNVPLYLAAIRDGMLSLGGSKGDGLSLSAAASPEYVRHAVTIAREAAIQAGRRPDGFAIACNIILATAPTKKEGLQRAKMELARILLGGHDYLFQYQPAKIDKEDVRQALATKSADALDRAIPDETADALAVCGRPDEIKAALARFADAGLTIALLRLSGSLDEQLQTLKQL